MLFTILLLLKILLFMNIIKIEHNRLIIFLISTLVTLFVFTLIYFSNNKKKQVLAFSFYNIMSVIMFADVMYYTFFNTLPSIKMVKLLGQVGAVGDSVKSIFSFTNFLFLIDIPFLIIYSKKKKRKIEREDKEYNGYIKWGVPSAIGLILVVALIVLSKVELFGPITNQELYTYHAKDIKKAIMGEEGIAEKTGVFTQKDLEELKERTALKQGKYTGIGKDKNLIVIQVEALQNFPINLVYEGQEVTPNLNKLIKKQGSLYFDNYYQLIGRGNTSDAEFITNNSLHPSMEDPTYIQYEKNTFYGLPWILRDEGYTSWAFHGYKKEFWNREKAYVNQGFQRYINEEDFDVVETSGLGITDEEFFKQSMNYLKELDNMDENPFYAFMITLTSHNPFNIPEGLRYLDIKEEHKDTILGDYIQSVHYVDRTIGEFIKYLKEENLYEDSIIALYGDHFGITALDDSIAELMTDFLGYPYEVDEMFKIPLIIHVPGEKINETISKVGSQIDFLPTILNIMGYENKKGIMFGRDLVNYEGYNFVAPQYYVLKGSFIDEDVFFNMSNDSIFENCTAKDRKTRKLLDVESLRDKYEKIIAELNKSDYVLKKDLIKNMIENDGEVDFNVIANQDIPGDKRIENCYTNPLEQLNENYADGNRIMAVELEWSDDKEQVLLREEGANGNRTDMKDLANWMGKHPEAYIILRSSEKGESIFLKVKDEYPEIKDRFVVEMKEFKEYVKLVHKAYKNVLLNLSHSAYTEEELIDFMKKNRIWGVIMDEKLGKTKLPKTLKELNINTYVEGVNSKIKMKKLERNNVYGFFMSQGTGV